jgi:hypothetical protein
MQQNSGVVISGRSLDRDLDEKGGPSGPGGFKIMHHLAELMRGP